MRSSADPVIRFLWVFLLASAIFFLTAPSLSVYLLLLDAAGLSLLLAYGAKSGKGFLQGLVILGLGSGAAFLSVKLLTGHLFRRPTPLEFFLLLLAAMELLLAGVLCQERQEAAQAPLPPLYSERRYDLQRLREYLRQFELVGIDAGWGTGKTFLLGHLAQDKAIRDEFFLIQIDLLACDLDSVELILVDELEKLFRRGGVFPETSRRLKRLLGENQWAALLGELTMEEPAGLSTSLLRLRQELSKLDKKVLIVFEDLDRISQPDTIRKIFAISEKLSGERLHVVFQYDAQVLADLGFSRAYLEKYIPYTMRLTPIPYEKLVDYFWQELDMDASGLSQRAVRNLLLSPSPAAYELERILNLQLHTEVRLKDEISPRKVRAFLTELRELLLSNPTAFSQEKVSDSILRILFMKHFFHDRFQLLHIGESPLEVFTLKVGETRVLTLPELVRECRPEPSEHPYARNDRLLRIRGFLADQENREAWFLLPFLGYHMDAGPIEGSLSDIAAETGDHLQLRAQNEKLDRLVWNVLANGASEFTDQETAARKFLSQVLGRPREEWESAWEGYQHALYTGNLWKDGTTIFRFGIDPYFSLFQAVKVTGATPAQWEALLDFYFSQYQQDAPTKTISASFIDCCNYCDCHIKGIFLRVVRFMGGLSVAGNMNDEPSYRQFFHHYMGAISALGYSERTEGTMFRLPKGEIDPALPLSLLASLLEDLERQARKETYPYVREEYEDLIRFVEKNRELIQAPHSLPQRGPSVSVTETSSRWVHQEEVDHLLALREKDPARFPQELERSYRAGKLYLRELRAVTAQELPSPRS